MGRPVTRPVRVKIPHSLFDIDRDHSICLFCRSADKEAIEKYARENSVPGLAKVVSLDEVKKLYKVYKDRKSLLAEYSHFLCDARIMNHVYNLLGKVFATNNHFPSPIDLENMDKLSSSVSKAVNSSFMAIKGENITIKLGNTAMSSNEITENVLSGLEFGIAKLKNEWKSIHSIHLKTPFSPAIPIYSKKASSELKFVKKSIKENEKKGAENNGTISSKNKEKTSNKKEPVSSSKDSASNARTVSESSPKKRKSDADSSVVDLKKKKVEITGNDKSQKKEIATKLSPKASVVKVGTKKLVKK